MSVTGSYFEKLPVIKLDNINPLNSKMHDDYKHASLSVKQSTKHLFENCELLSTLNTDLPEHTD